MEEGYSTIYLHTEGYVYPMSCNIETVVTHYLKEPNPSGIHIDKITDDIHVFVAKDGKFIGFIDSFKKSNVWQLTEGRDFNHKKTIEARNLNITQNFLRSSNPRFWVGAVIGSCFVNQYKHGR